MPTRARVSHLTNAARRLRLSRFRPITTRPCLLGQRTTSGHVAIEEAPASESRPTTVAPFKRAPAILSRLPHPCSEHVRCELVQCEAGSRLTRRRQLFGIEPFP